METKYGFNIEESTLDKVAVRLVNQIWKLIPMREHEEDWTKQLETVTVEISGLNEIFRLSPLFIQLLSKLEGLRVTETDFETYRKTVFDMINLLQELKRHES